MNVSDMNTTLLSCTDDQPFSHVFFKEMKTTIIVLIVIGSICTVVTTTLCTVRAYTLSKTTTSYGTHAYIIVYLGPVMSVLALLGLYIPRSSEISDLMSDLYISSYIWILSDLLLLKSGGIKGILSNGPKTFRINNPPLLCCCPCLPAVKVTKAYILRIRVTVIQVGVVKPITAFIIATLWSDGRVIPGKLDMASVVPYLSIINTISTLVAMYGLVNFHRLVSPIINAPQTKLNFVLLQLVLLFCNLQPVIIKLIVRYTWPACLSQMNAAFAAAYLQDFIIIVEMLLMGIMIFLMYTKLVSKNATDDCEDKPTEDETLIPQQQISD